jgi:ABC-2 type transport system permease protein
VNKFWTILTSEYLQVVKKKSFLIGVVLTPILMIGITVLPALFAMKGVTSPVSYAIIDLDGRGIGEELANQLGTYRLDGDTTRQAYNVQEIYRIAPDDQASIDSLRNFLDSLLEAGSLKNYIIISPAVEQNDSIMMVSKSLSFKSIARYDNNISNILAKMRLNSSDINLPVDSVLSMTRRVDMIQVSPGGKSRDFLGIYFGALIFIMIIFVPVMSFGQILMRSVIEEKNSRIIEVIISSASPFQLMMGKILGLGAANLTQVLIWVAMGLVLFFVRGSVNIPEQAADILFNPVLIGFFIVFLLLAYVMFSTIFAMIGAICTTDKESQNFVMPLSLSMIVPIVFLMYILQEPESLVTTIISFIPLFTPMMMIARLNVLLPDAFSFANAIVLEATLGVLLLILVNLFLVWVTSRIFRVGILMYGKRATLPEIMKWVRYK